MKLTGTNKEPTDSANGSPSGSRMTLLELLLLATTMGLLAGAALGTFDIFYHGLQLSPGDVLVALSLGAVPAVVAVVSVAAMLAFLFAILRKQPNRQSWVGLLLGVAVVGLAAAVILVGTKSYRDWLGLLAVLGSFPIAVAAHGMVMKRSWLDQPGRAIVVGLAALQVVIIVVCGIATVRVRGFHWIAGCVPFVLTLVAFVWVVGRIPRYPLRAGIALLICMPVTGTLFANFGRPRVVIPSFTTFARSDKRPNVVLIVLDTTRRDVLGCYGHAGGLTPELDRIAAEGVVYEQAISAAPWTVPSHASMFTGLYPVTHGCSYEHHIWLDDEFETLAETLRDDGYQTVALSSNYLLADCNLLQGFDTQVYLPAPYSDVALRHVAKVIGTPRHWVDKGASEACDALEEWLSRQYNAASPFFLFLNLFETHGKYIPPRTERAAHLPDDVGYWEATRLALEFSPTVAHFRRVEDPYVRKVMHGLYEAEACYQDRRLGEFFALLRQHTDFDNTLLIVTADHGENLGDGRRWQHLHAINDVLIHVPLIIRYPALFPSATRLSGLCATVDIVPTIYHVLGGDRPELEMPGRSLVPAHFVPQPAVFSQVAPFYPDFSVMLQTLGFDAGFNGYNALRRVIRTEDYKYIWFSDGKHRLYDIRSDPQELVNLVARKPELAQRLHQQLLDWLDAQPKYVPKKNDRPRVPLDDKTIDTLRSLGYIGD